MDDDELTEDELVRLEREIDKFRDAVKVEMRKMKREMRKNLYVVRDFPEDVPKESYELREESATTERKTETGP